MENQHEVEADKYQSGFNQGYLIAKYQPELIEKLIPSMEVETPYNEGFLNGKQQCDHEKIKERHKDSLNLPKKDIERERE